MIRDARGLDRALTLRTTVCVVGAGPLGIAIALEFARTGIDVVLLESGGYETDSDSAALDEGEVVDPARHSPLEASRRRVLGGATVAWAGRCVPFDPIDFEPRPWMPGSGWPLAYGDVEPWYRKAHEYLQLGSFEYRASHVIAGAGRSRGPLPGDLPGDLVADSVYLFSPPVNFGRVYRRALKHASRLSVWLHATCVDLVPGPDGRSVTRVVARTPAGTALSVDPRHVVLAVGGLEVVRLLLAADHGNGIGDRHDLVGRYYMSHTVGHLEVVFASDDVVWNYERTESGLYCQRTIALSPDAQRRLRMPNHRARIEPPDIADPSHRSGVLSAAYLIKRRLHQTGLWRRFPSLSRGFLRTDHRLPLRPHVRNVLVDLPATAAFAGHWLRRRLLSTPTLPSIVLPGRDRRQMLRFEVEQLPCRESRVTLGNQVDRYGMPRLRVDWRRNPGEEEQFETLARTVGDELVVAGLARRLGSPRLVSDTTSGHHIGTTRMSASPETGVVDPYGRVHDVDNLWIAGASVFRTSSYANPTVTALALALRLQARVAAAVRQDALAMTRA